MAQGKLSQQLETSPNSEQRQSRTKKKILVLQQKKERERFLDLKRKAQEIKQSEFSQLSSVEDYEDKYQSLSSEIKPFFQTPDEVNDARIERINDAKNSITQELSLNDLKKIEAKQHYDERLKKAQEIYIRKKQGTSNKEKRDLYKKQFKEKEDDYDDDLDEDLARLRGYEKGLKEAQGKLNQNQLITFESAKSYASDIGNYYEDRERARNENSALKREQEQKIDNLIEGGYQPQVIQQFKNGNPVQTALSFYNQKTGDWVNVAKYDTKGEINVSGLKRIGSAPAQKSILEFAGKQYEYKSSVGVYAKKSGDIVTPYGETGLNENVLLKQQKDNAYQIFLDERKSKPINLNFTVLTKKDLPIGYGSQQTKSSQPLTVFQSDNQRYLTESSPNIIEKSFGLFFKGQDYLRQRIRYTDKGITFGKSNQKTKPETTVDFTLAKLDEESLKIDKQVIGESNINILKTSLDTKYQTQYQTAFEDKYMKQLIYGDIEFDNAVTQFENSNQSKIIKKKYSEEYQGSYEQLQKDVPFLKGRVIGGLQQQRISLQKLAVKSVRSPVDTATAVLTVQALGSAGKVIPNSLGLGLSAGLFSYGSYKFLSPDSTYIEAGSGLLTAAISGGVLAYAGYKYLKSPVITTKTIKAPQSTLKSSEVIGKDVKIINPDGTVSNKVIFGNQKLSQYAQSGRRTLVTTRGRIYKAAFWKSLGVNTPAKNLYITRGLPSDYQQPLRYITSSRGTQVIKGTSNYQKAFTKLTNYGYSSSQAKSTLRYYAPRITEQYLQKGVLQISGDRAKGEFNYLTKRSIIDVNKNLGIKTKGSSGVRDSYLIDRKIVDIDGTQAFLEEKSRLTSVLNAKGQITQFKEFQYAKSINVAKSSASYKGLEPKGKIGGFDIYKESTFKDIYGGGIERRLFPQSKYLNVDFTKSKLFDDILDLRASKGVKKANIKKTPLSKTFSEDVVKEIQKLQKPTQAKNSININKVINKITKQSNLQPQGQYYGTGQYEKTDGSGILNIDQLKSPATIPAVKLMNIRNILPKQNFNYGLGSGVAAASSVQLKTLLRNDINVKTNLKLNNNLKTYLKNEIKQEVEQKQEPKLTTSLKNNIKTILETSTVNPIIQTPIQSGSLPVIVLPSVEKIQRLIKLKKAKTKKVEELYYVPDFTSRAIGLSPIEIKSVKQANKLLRKINTGFEIRRSVLVNIPN